MPLLSSCIRILFVALCVVSVDGKSPFSLPQLVMLGSFEVSEVLCSFRYLSINPFSVILVSEISSRLPQLRLAECNANCQGLTVEAVGVYAKATYKDSIAAFRQCEEREWSCAVIFKI